LEHSSGIREELKKSGIEFSICNKNYNKDEYNNSTLFNERKLKMEKTIINFAKVDANSDAKIPTKKSEDAGYDIYACFKDDFIKVPAHETVLVPTGIATALPINFYFQIEERGSTGSKGMKKSAGVIDSGFRGEWFIAITNTNAKSLYIAKENVRDKLKEAANVLDKEIIIYPYEKAIAQAVLHEVHDVDVKEISYAELQDIKSERGTNMLGASNK
jgi:dUTP pyrophosphatase